MFVKGCILVQCLVGGEIRSSWLHFNPLCLWVKIIDEHFVSLLFLLCPSRRLPSSEEDCYPSPSSFLCLEDPDTTIYTGFFHLVPEHLSSLPSSICVPFNLYFCLKNGLLWIDAPNPGWTCPPQVQPWSLRSQRTVSSRSDLGQGPLCGGQIGPSSQHWAAGCCQDDWQDKTWCYGNKSSLTGSQVKTGPNGRNSQYKRH